MSRIIFEAKHPTPPNIGSKGYERLGKLVQQLAQTEETKGVIPQLLCDLAQAVQDGDELKEMLKTAGVSVSSVTSSE